MSYITLPRRDLFSQQNNCFFIYGMQDLSKIDSNLRPIVLRVVKKAILGINLDRLHSSYNSFINTFIRMVFFNIYCLVFNEYPFYPEIFFFNSKKVETNINIKEKNEKENIGGFDFQFVRLFIYNFLDIFCLIFLIFRYKYDKKKYNNYMIKYTQCAISPENKILKDFLICEISQEKDCNIDIYSKSKIKNKNKFNELNEKIFFEYVINFPLRNYSYYYKYYNKLLLTKEKQIITNMIQIKNEIDNKSWKKILKFYIMIIFIICYIPIISKFVDIGKTGQIINCFGVLLLIIYFEINNSLKINKEKNEKISSLNNIYINDGYYIHVDNEMTSIFFLKEKFRNIKSLGKIKYYNNKLRNEFEII